jgi:hypothetical protein
MPKLAPLVIIPKDQELVFSIFPLSFLMPHGKITKFLLQQWKIAQVPKNNLVINLLEHGFSHSSAISARNL